MAETKTLNPMAMTADEVARALGVPREWLEEDLEVGAPRNADGTHILTPHVTLVKARGQST